MYIPLAVITWLLGVVGALITAIGVRKSLDESASVLWWYVSLFGVCVLIFGFLVGIGMVPV